MTQQIYKIDSTTTVVKATIVNSAVTVQSAARVQSATSTTYTYKNNKQQIKGAAYVQVLSQKDFDALSQKSQDTFYFILDRDFSPVISTEGDCDTSWFEQQMLEIIGEDAEVPQYLPPVISVVDNTLILESTNINVNNGNLVLG